MHRTLVRHCPSMTQHSRWTHASAFPSYAARSLARVLRRSTFAAALLATTSGSASVAWAQVAQGGRPLERQAFHDVGARARFVEILNVAASSNAPNLVGPSRWSTLVAQHREAIESCRSHESFAAAVNRLLHDTGVSHFTYHTDEDWAFWHMRGLFGSGKEDEIEHIGIYPQKIDGRWFVRGILEGSLADGGEIRVGDELISVDGSPYAPITAFHGTAGRPTQIRLRRRPDLFVNLEVIPRRELLYQVMQDAIQASVRVMEHESLRLAYLHGWTLLGSGSEFDTLVNMQDDVDGLLLDWRDGLGGTMDRAMHFLVGPDDPPAGSPPSPQWHKPVVVLVADGTRSAKELVIDAARKAHRAVLVGEPTPGHVTSVGGIEKIGDDALLMLPGHRFHLEGKPTQPDYLIRREIRHGNGADPQLVAAKEVLAQLIKDRARRSSSAKSPAANPPPSPR
ncbi:MAG: S41 family peptidase [Planctomycetota bacterium]